MAQLATQVSQLIGHIYDAARGERDWHAVLGQMAQFCGAENAALVTVDHALGYSSVLAPRADPAVIDAYHRYWWARDPTVQATTSAPVGRVTSLADTGRDRFFASDFYQEFWVGSGLGAERLAVNLERLPQGFSSCVLQASTRRDHLPRASLERFSLLTPHLAKALTLQRTLQHLSLSHLRLALHAGNSLAALILLDRYGRVCFADAVAQEWLRHTHALRVRHGILQAASAKDQLAIEQAIANCQRGLPTLAEHALSLRHSETECWQLDFVPPRRQHQALPGLPAEATVVVVMSHRVTEASPGSNPAPLSDINAGTKSGSGPDTLPATGRRLGERGSSAAAVRRLFDRITQDLEQHAGEPDLSLAWLARRHQITTRRLRDIFYSQNTRFSECLLGARLALARQRLCNPRYRHHTISAIALESGFGDLSWFHQVFRREFGVTPAQMRREALAQTHMVEKPPRQGR